MTRAATYASRRYALVNRWDERHEATVQRLVAPGEGMRVLEIGCGRGHLAKRLQEWGCDVTAVDANPHAAAEAVTDVVQTMRADELTFDDATFDLVVSVHTIEHLPDLDAAFTQMARVLKPGGRMLHIYPAEPIQGLFAVPTAVILHRNPFAARRVHCQWLWPSKVTRLAAPHRLESRHDEFQLLSTPQFAHVLQRT